MLTDETKKQYEIPLDTKEMQCPDCEKWSNIDEWESDVWQWGEYEEMVAMQCPKCEELFERYTVKFNCA